MAGRAFAFADPKIIELCKTTFVPCCADDWYQRRRQDDEGTFFRKVAEFKWSTFVKPGLGVEVHASVRASRLKIKARIEEARDSNDRRRNLRSWRNATPSEYDSATSSTRTHPLRCKKWKTTCHDKSLPP